MLGVLVCAALVRAVLSAAMWTWPSHYLFTTCGCRAYAAIEVAVQSQGMSDTTCRRKIITLQHACITNNTDQKKAKKMHEWSVNKWLTFNYSWSNDDEYSWRHWWVIIEYSILDWSTDDEYSWRHWWMSVLDWSTDWHIWGAIGPWPPPCVTKNQFCL